MYQPVNVQAVCKIDRYVPSQFEQNHLQRMAHSFLKIPKGGIAIEGNRRYLVGLSGIFHNGFSQPSSISLAGSRPSKAAACSAVRCSRL
jgi:hypothetical protein